MRTHVDVAVVGAGPAGSALARRLAIQGFRVALLEASNFERPRVGESLAPNVQGLLRELGVWDAFEALRPLPCYGTRSIWGDPEPQEHSHLASPYGSGWFVNRSEMDRMLAQEAVNAGAILKPKTRAIDIERSPTGWRLHCMHGSNPETVAALFVVDATGRKGLLARRLGAVRKCSDRLVGVAAQLHHDNTVEQNFILIESDQSGWWYSAPTRRDRLIAVRMTDSDLLQGRGRADDWSSALASSTFTSARLLEGSRRKFSERFLWPPRPVSAVSQRLRRSDGSQPWLAVGDAALSVDPISGSGVLRALQSSKSAAQAVRDHLSGDRSALEAYEDSLDGDYLGYLQERAAHYSLERRWREAPFWARRLRSAALLKI